MITVMDSIPWWTYTSHAGYKPDAYKPCWAHPTRSRSIQDVPCTLHAYAYARRAKHTLGLYKPCQEQPWSIQAPSCLHFFRVLRVSFAYTMCIKWTLKEHFISLSFFISRVKHTSLYKSCQAHPYVYVYKLCLVHLMSMQAMPSAT